MFVARMFPRWGGQRWETMEPYKGAVSAPSLKTLGLNMRE